MKLVDVPAGTTVVVKSIPAGLGASITLRELGIVEGAKVKVIRNSPFGGPLIVEVNGARYALGRGLASKVEVEPLH
ncbi:FeoA family protein [Ignicoccus pacificus DSM 13166]|uniref:FeoA family protein n=1 Tax=Ignicoccus pacificus DSM 13166 TaxID=940294 RepID=A0A977K9E7_9CREN|nr:FeoA family protein [Ignicoccus pacificus DSM 13166]